jgi:ankyrin repeat protein
VKLLVEVQVESNTLNSKEDSVLSVAAYHGHTDMVKFLVQEGKADVNLQLQTGNYGSALAAACGWYESVEFVKFLVHEGRADVDLLLNEGKYDSPLAAAAYVGNKETVEFLIGAGAKVNLKLETGRFGTALQAARVDISKDDLWLRPYYKRDTWRQEKDEVLALLKQHGATD